MYNLSKKYEKISPSVTLSITAKAKNMIKQGIDVVTFAAGEPDFKTPKNIRDEAIRVIKEGKIGYTAASGLPELKQAICDKFKKDNNLEYYPENIIVSNGAKHSLFNTLQAICNPGDEVIIFKPYWVTYPELVKMAGAEPVFVDTYEEDGFEFKLENLTKKINSKTKAIMINSPNNPTGSVYSEEKLREIADIAVKNNIFIISDEIYEKLTYEGKHISIASFNDDIKKLTIVINGLSKAYAMTGWRIGYLAADKIVSKMISNIQSHSTSNPNTIAQYAGIKALTSDEDDIIKMKQAFLERRNYMVERINLIDKVSCKKPNGAFYVMMNISELLGKCLNGTQINDSMDFANYLLDNAKVAVIPGAGFGVDGYVRLSYATSLDEIKEGLNRIEKAIK